MRITKYVHSCVLVEDGDARVLLDPGVFSRGFEELRGLTAVLVTHSHADHLDPERLMALLAANPDATVVADSESAAQLATHGIDADVVDAGASRSVGGLAVEVFGSEHAVIHPDIPTIPNVGYLLGGRLFHPGDALTVPPVEVELLALPLTAPWSKLSETVDYVRAVAPRTVLPIHDAILAIPAPYLGNVERLAPARTRLQALESGQPAEL